MCGRYRSTAVAMREKYDAFGNGADPVDTENAFHTVGAVLSRTLNPARSSTSP